MRSSRRTSKFSLLPISLFLFFLLILSFLSLLLISAKNRPPSPASIKSSNNSNSISAMDSHSSSSDPNSDPSEVVHSFIFFNVLRNGRVNIYSPPLRLVPAADDPSTGVRVKDVKISGEVSARVFLPPLPAGGGDVRLPVLLYVHGGGFCMQSAFSAEYTAFVLSLVSLSKVIAVSVEYRMFPGHSISLSYEDAWTALHWIASHSGDGPAADEWIGRHADLRKVFIAGDSAGGNICHTLAARAGRGGLPGGVRLTGMVLIHPYFGEDDKMWMYMCPENDGPADRRMKPAAEDLTAVAAERALVIVAERDLLKEAGVKYAAGLKGSGWRGVVELAENKQRDHCWFFNSDNRNDDEAIGNLRRINSFIHQQDHQD